MQSISVSGTLNSMPHSSGDDRLRLLYLSRQCPPAIGGAQTANAELLRHLGKVMAVTRETGSYQSAAGIAYYYVSRFLRLRFSARNYDAIFAADVSLTPLALRLANGRVPVVSWAHGLDVTYPMRLYQTHVVRSLSRCARILAVSKSTQRALTTRGIPPDRISIVPQGVSIPRQLVAKPEARRRLGFGQDDSPWLLSLGRLVPRKGIAEFTARVFPKLRRHLPNLRFVIAGDGPERIKIQTVIREKALADSVRMFGEVTEDTKSLLYRAADVFVVPNRPVENNIEGFGLTILEANAHALPVLASDVDCLSEILIDGKNGYLVKDENYLEPLLTCLGQSQSTLRFTTQEFAQKFSWENTATEITTYLRRAGGIP